MNAYSRDCMIYGIVLTQITILQTRAAVLCRGKCVRMCVVLLCIVRMCFWSLWRACAICTRVWSHILIYGIVLTQITILQTSKRCRFMSRKAYAYVRCAFVHLCIVRMCVCVCALVRMCTRAHVHMCACAHVRVCACAYAYVNGME